MTNKSITMNPKAIKVTLIILGIALLVLGGYFSYAKAVEYSTNWTMQLIQSDNPTTQVHFFDQSQLR